MSITADLMQDEGHAFKYQAFHLRRPDLRIVELHLGPTQEVPWHYHNHVEDTIYVLRGQISVEVKEPEEKVRLAPGDTYTVPRRRPHFVSNVGGGTAAFLIIQGIGEYDFAH